MRNNSSDNSNSNSRRLLIVVATAAMATVEAAVPCILPFCGASNNSKCNNSSSHGRRVRRRAAVTRTELLLDPLLLDQLRKHPLPLVGELMRRLHSEAHLTKCRPPSLMRGMELEAAPEVATIAAPLAALSAMCLAIRRL